MTRSVTILAMATALLLAACGADIADETSATSPQVVADVDEPTTTIEGAQEMQDSGESTSPARTDRSHDGDGYSGELGGSVGIAIADLAVRQGVEASEISVVSVEAVVWPNAGMGCPHPDMRYAQVMVDGLRIVLVHDGVQYRYHSGGSVEPFLCLPATTTDTWSSIIDPNDIAERSDDAVDSVPNPVTPNTPKGSMPTEQFGGPGGPPND